MMRRLALAFKVLLGRDAHVLSFNEMYALAADSDSHGFEVGYRKALVDHGIDYEGRWATVAKHGCVTIQKQKN